MLLIYQDLIFRDLPDCSVVKMPPSNARGVGLICGQGTKIPHAESQKMGEKKEIQTLGHGILDRNPLTIHREESGAFNLAIRQYPN